MDTKQQSQKAPQRRDGRREDKQAKPAFQSPSASVPPLRCSRFPIRVPPRHPLANSPLTAACGGLHFSLSQRERAGVREKASGVQLNANKQNQKAPQRRDRRREDKQAKPAFQSPSASVPPLRCSRFPIRVPPRHPLANSPLTAACGGLRSSLSQRERAGVRENSREVPVAACTARLRCLSPSPYPSPAGKGHDAARLSVSCLFVCLVGNPLSP
jgi:hypothetical protein